jgi:hypothetical protein
MKALVSGVNFPESLIDNLAHFPSHFPLKI